MNLSGQKLAVLLTEEGRQVLALASVGDVESPSISVSVEESEELGLWIRVPRGSGAFLPASMGVHFGRRSAEWNRQARRTPQVGRIAHYLDMAAFTSGHFRG
jgi:hypothetical protein